VFDTLIEKLTGTVVEESAKIRVALEEGFRGSLRGTRLTGALPRPVQANAANYVAPGRLVGWSIRATVGEVVLNLYDGPAADPARFLAAVDLPVGGSQSVWLGPGGVSFVDGVYVEVTGGGTPVGALWIGAVD
jgi:hypothetical protein